MASCCDLLTADGCAVHRRAAPGATLDRAAMLLSSICLIHCVALPVLIAFLPAFSFLLPPLPWLHAALLGLALPLSGLALWRGWRAHRLVMPAQLGVAGLAVLASALLVHDHHPLVDAALTVCGGLLVATGHWLNWDGLRRSR